MESLVSNFKIFIFICLSMWRNKSGTFDAIFVLRSRLFKQQTGSYHIININESKSQDRRQVEWGDDGSGWKIRWKTTEMHNNCNHVSSSPLNSVFKSVPVPFITNAFFPGCERERKKGDFLKFSFKTSTKQ